MAEPSVEWMTFYLSQELYAVDILAVKEIRSPSSVTRIPLSPPEIMGAINLRGDIVPIVDLRARLQLDPVADSEDTVFIIVQYQHNDRAKTLGMRVDAVADVIRVDQIEIDQQSHAESLSCVEAIAQHNQGSVALLNVKQLLTTGNSATLAMELE